jgi:hypothetical protein
MIRKEILTPHFFVKKFIYIFIESMRESQEKYASANMAA